MSLTLEEVEHIAELAKLDLTEEEKTKYQQQLSAVLEYIARLQALDTTHIPPTFSVLPGSSALRPDDPRPGLGLDELMSNAPDATEDQFRVPPVLD
jgi:aspartyl-tRNA(Asn)/glutamyl-tRNA(Gln) amidotransferase subunit C